MTPPADLPPEGRARRRRWRLVVLLVAGSLLLHALVAWIAGHWTIVHGVPRQGVPILIARRATEASAPAGGGGAPAEVPVPAVPAAEAVATIPAFAPHPAEIAAPALPAAARSVPAAGRGEAVGSGNGNGTGGEGGGLSLFGLQGDARRVMIAVDVSKSMFTRMPQAFAQIMAEADAAIDRLGERTAFDLLVFEDGSLAWQPALVPATAANRADARRWLDGIAALGPRFGVRGGKGTMLSEGGGTRGDTALRQAFSLGPDWLVVLTDGDWNTVALNSPGHHFDAAEITALAATLQQGRRFPMRIDVVFLVTPKTRPGDSATARALAEGNGGRLVEFRPDLPPR